MEDAFEKLKVKKQNDVGNLVKWLKDSQLIEATKEAEEKARKLFDDVKDAKNVELEKFKSAVVKLAEEQKKTVDEFNKMLASKSAALMEALTAGATAGVSAFKTTLEKADK